MGDDRNLAALLLLGYALGAGVALSQIDPGRGIESLYDGGFIETVAIGGVFVGASTLMVIVGIATVTFVVLEILRWPREHHVAAGLTGAIVLWIGVNTWVAAPYDVRGDQWIGSPVSQVRILLVRGMSLGLLILLIVSFLWLFHREGKTTPQHSRTKEI